MLSDTGVGKNEKDSLELVSGSCLLTSEKYSEFVKQVSKRYWSASDEIDFCKDK